MRFSGVGLLAGLVQVLIVVVVISVFTGGRVHSDLARVADIVVPDDLEITVHNDTEGDLFLIEGTLWQDRFGGPLKVSTVAAGGASTFSVEPNNRLSWCQPRNWGIWAIEDFEGPGQIAGAPEAPLAKLVPKIRDASPDGFDVVSKLRVGRCWGRPSGEWRVAAPEG